MEHISAAPFGARLTVAAAAVQAMADACPREARVSKWAVLKAVSEARARLGLSDRAVAVLHAMLSFVAGEEIAAGEVVFPSNATLAARAHGMAAPTLRRQVAQLVAAGLIVRRDSPNGKRYARKGEDGAIALAFGFELTPLVARVAELQALAAAVAEERRACRGLRERITLMRRDIAATQACLAAEGETAAVTALPPPLPRTAGLADLEGAAYDLGLIKAETDKRLATLVKSRNSSASATPSERHIQDSNHIPSDSELLREREQADAPAADRPDRGRAADPAAAPTPRIDLAAVLAACPTLRDWIPRKVTSWEDLVRAAETVRPALGISPDAWREAVGAMGEGGAAVTLATMLQRAEAIASPGGYLRALSAKARAGKFTPAPIVVSLLRQRAKAAVP